MSYRNQPVSSFTAGAIWASLQSLLRILPLFIAAVLLSQQGVAQEIVEVTEDVLKSVMREADSFSPKEGNPPVYRAYKRDPASSESELLGYLFETPDYPPEEVGYSAPIDVLVGVDTAGTITGIEVLHYIESYKSIRGDFINSEYFFFWKCC